MLFFFLPQVASWGEKIILIHQVVFSWPTCYRCIWCFKLKPKKEDIILFSAESQRPKLLYITISVTTSTGVISCRHYCKTIRKHLQEHKWLFACAFIGGNNLFRVKIRSRFLWNTPLTDVGSIKAVFLITTQVFTWHVPMSVYLFSAVPSRKVVKEQTEQNMKRNNNSFVTCLSKKTGSKVGPEVRRGFSSTEWHYVSLWSLILPDWRFLSTELMQMSQRFIIPDLSVLWEYLQLCTGSGGQSTSSYCGLMWSVNNTNAADWHESLSSCELDSIHTVWHKQVKKENINLPLSCSPL